MKIEGEGLPWSGRKRIEVRAEVCPKVRVRERKSSEAAGTCFDRVRTDDTGMIQVVRL